MAFDRVIKGGMIVDGRNFPRYRADIVVDHHPLREETLEVPFADVGGDFGATSTMLVEYLRAARMEPQAQLEG